jgi:hypothetical protein
VNGGDARSPSWSHDCISAPPEGSMQKVERIVGAGLLALVAGAGAAALAADGCSSSGGTGGDDTGSSVATGAGGSKALPPPCPFVVDAGPDVFLGPDMPTPEDVSLCGVLAAKASTCNPGCPTETLVVCAHGWACLRDALRPDMVADFYACVPGLPCSEKTPPIVACVATLGAKYTPSAAETAYEAAVAAYTTACQPGMPSFCADGVCAGYSDAVYEALTQCLNRRVGNSDDACFSVFLCPDLLQQVTADIACEVLSGLIGDGGAGSGGGGGAGGGDDGGGTGGDDGG